MLITAESADTSGAHSKSASARIADMRTPVLEVNYAAESGLDALIEFVRHSPLGGKIGRDLSEFSFEGPTTVTGALRIPLGANRGPPEVEGSVVLEGNRFASPQHAIRLDGIRGRLRYDENGFHARALEAVYEETQARLEVEAGTGGNEKFRAELSGEFDVQDILPDSLDAALAELQRADRKSTRLNSSH